MNSCETIAQFLIEKGININQTNKYGWNALKLASFLGNKEIAELLMNKKTKNQKEYFNTNKFFEFLNILSNSLMTEIFCVIFEV